MAIFAASLFCFLLYLHNHRERKRGRDAPARDPAIETTTDATKRAQEIRKVPAGDYYSIKLDTLSKMLQSASEEVEREERRLDYLTTLNQYGAVINEKNIRRAESDLYKARRKKLTIVSQIHSTKREAEQAGQ